MSTNQAPSPRETDWWSVRMWNQTISFLQLQTIYQLQIFNTSNSDIWCKMFLGSRTSFELCECIPLVAELPRWCPEVEFAQYTKNHAWMSAMINLDMDPAKSSNIINCGGVAANYSMCSTTQMPTMSLQMYEFKLTTEVFFTNKNRRRSHVGLDI